MRALPTRLGLALAGVAFLSLVVAVTVGFAADDDPAPEPVAGITNLMNALNSEEHGLYGMIKTFCDAGGQASADDWKLMRHRAQVIAEGANILMEKSPPRGADDAAGLAKWKQHCVDYREAVKGLSKALAYKQVDKVRAALEGVAARCEACHTDHRSN